MPRPPVRHPLAVRIAHWLNALAIACMISSGWGIYNASPIFGFKFAPWMTLGGWLGGSIAWHLAAMWLLVVNGLFYLLYGSVSGHFRRHLLPLHMSEVLQDARQALRFRLPHQPGVYNAVQKLLYWVVILLGILVVLSGLAIWKPVQLDWLAAFFGGFDVARKVHFVAMAGIAGFVVVHLTLVAIVPKTLVPMLTGGRDNQASSS
ncbi:cytochrome b/b6 domain-containing protein [uncultured Herbaspirillum sp.]|jgi:thiosulfate reductase cytochrome b subunit|uniref:cytochrome b/b6 domain-containing protein n=1 Tax=uncultured Herbaspirillum sp. TaxID=160236 RepID=UPI00258E5DE6|nr:cytochrome b/b6 domain-containing protein [uncultured Herbaspirillum sp.]